MSDPYEVLRSIDRLLDPQGTCLITMPVFPNAAYDVFGVYWYQWDAPRHLFLHSVKSMECLCARTGMRIENVIFNSGDKQFTSSLLYRKGIPYVKHDDMLIRNEFSMQELVEFKSLTEELNKKGYGDHAVFVIAKDGV